MLNKLRNQLEPFINWLARMVVSLGLSPNQLSILGFISSIAAGIMYSLSSRTTSNNPYMFVQLAGIILLIAGFFDVLDGAVARLTHKASKRGAYLDSILDKVAEIFILISIYLGGLSSAIWCLIALSLALLVSYARARAESLNIPLIGIGIGERAERLLILALIGMIPFAGAMQIAVIIVSIVSGVTIIQRISTVIRRL
ncbi:MAG TPA: CDP-alcohol phosphatidyltransferase family protein [Nitrososphaeraceae archaeon]|jgi:archaetidylinositol phosphate synthase